MKGSWTGVLVVALAAAAAGGYFFVRSRNRLPAPGSPIYEDTTRNFYRGLAELQVGLLDDAKREFTKTTELVPDEPAGWANLGLSHLRLGDFDGAAPPIAKAASLAPRSSDVTFLQGRLETSRGKLDEGIAHYKRAAELDAGNLRARYALAEEVERAAGPDADLQAQQYFDEILRARPGNLAVLLERARLAAKRSDASSLDDSVRALTQFQAGWPQPAAEQYRALQAAASARSFQDAARDVAFLRNVLVRVTMFRESLAAVRTPTELIAEPLERFLRLTPPSSSPSPVDDALTFTREPAAAAGSAPRELELDWNRDFMLDRAVVGTNGLRLSLQQTDGTFSDATARLGVPVTQDAFGVWAADLDMDGDLDLIVGVRGGPPVVLRNNGDGTARRLAQFSGVAGVRAFAWGDVDGDGDSDAVVLDERGDLHVFENRQAGEFREFAAFPGKVVAVAVGDLDADGTLDVVTLGAAGEIARTSMRNGAWQTQNVAKWEGPIPRDDAVGSCRLFLADLDNNGTLDVIASEAARTNVWLVDESYVARSFQGLQEPVLAIADVNNDGMLDLVSASARFLGKGTKGYHWQVMRPKAQPTAGDQRINSFGVGGEIEIRSGLLTQRQVLTGQPAHFGLGTRTGIDVARIFWPNGIMQADFDRQADQSVVAEQRLKGSCPWVFTYDGAGMRFVTDFLWRSPLGLRINAVDTAGVTQTEDWIKIRGDQLVARDGAYDVRITAELWETHFVDHVSLLVVDHPADEEVFVDERFARDAPALAVRAFRNVHPIAHAWDEKGRDVTDTVSARDGKYLSTFERGPYQGIAQDHFVEFEGRQRWLIANGWIYPTDSSINVAISQAGTQPRGLSLEAQNGAGQWIVVAPDLGFPAGKNKTILIDLSQAGRAGAPNASRFRLRTNLEIYWDSLAVADAAPDDQIKTTRVPASRAELRYRGFSKTDFSKRDTPETPRYGELANVSQRWRDLIGYYTRYGDVSELLASVDDRYVIMNAGDEIRLAFSSPVAPKPTKSAEADGRRARDFVLIGDGWVKDGDYNTTFSKTVEPLPRHGHPNYETPAPALNIEDDPAYRAHAADWQKYHTRFIAPDRFLSGLR